jgi:phosphoribosylglycinamide formyltransferase-1
VLSLVVLISGSGSNLRALLEATNHPIFPARVLAVGADRAAPGLEHAELFDIQTFVVDPKHFASRELWAKALLSHIRHLQPDLVVLAGFMRILPAEFVNALSPNLINMHPSLLPEFPGAHAVRDALAAGASKTGSTIHVVDAGIDTGPILSQRELGIEPGITEPELHEQIKVIERDHLPQVIRQIAIGEIKLEESR